MEFNPYSIPLLISFMVIFCIGTLAYRYKIDSPINKSFFYYCLSLCYWLLNFAIMYNCKDASHALFWGKIGSLGVPFIAILAYFFIHRLLSISHIPYFKLLFVFALLPIALFNTDLIYCGIKKEFWGYYPIAGRFYLIYALFFSVLTIEGLRLLFVAMKTGPKNTPFYKQIKYVFFAFIIAITGIIDFIAKYYNHIYPFAWLSALSFISLISYAILKYQIEENELLRQEIIQTERLKAIASLASNLAHEIKNPLTSLATFTEYLPHKANDPEFIKKFEQVATKEIYRINSLVQDLLNFSKPSPPQLQTINPNILLEQIIHLIQQRCNSQKIKINTQFNNNSDIHADPNQLQQAFLNIILNAIDAMQNGGKLTIETTADKNNYLISISDTGCGIPQEDLKHIFDPFFTKKEKGTGLGLAITQGIIEKHGGKIKIHSELNKGTNFIIYLPKI